MVQLVESMSGVVKVEGLKVARGEIITASIGSVDSGE